MFQRASTARQTLEPERATPSAPEREGRSLGSLVGGLLGGIAKPVENFITALADLFAAPPPMTQEQAERAARANDEQAEARADHAAQQAKEAAQDWLIFKQNRQRQEQEVRAAVHGDDDEPERTRRRGRSL
jgi:predicted lipid-binding transport protein (Tim44 family)